MKKTAKGYTGSADNFPVYEQRYLPRWETESRAFYKIENRSLAKTYMKDLSVGGISLHVDPNVHVSENLKLKIYLADNINFEAEGTVVWKRTTLGRRCLAGVVFEPLSDKIQQMILTHAFEVNSLSKSKDT